MRNEYTLGGGYLKGMRTSPIVYYIADLWVHPCDRQHGIARELMRQVCEDADRENIILELECIPDRRVISHEDLENFYMKCGFQPKEIVGMWSAMRRLPIALRGPF